MAVMATSFHAVAQTNYEDVVYLKNGSVIHGMIIEQVPNESIKIKTADRNIFIFKMEEIEKITKELESTFIKDNPSVDVQVPLLNASEKKTNKKIKGFTNITETILAISFNKTESVNERYGDGNNYSYYSRFDVMNNHPSLGIQTVNGYQFNHWLMIGAGIGIQNYRNLPLFPLFLHIRSDIIDRKVSPFISAEIGESFTFIFGEHTWDDKGGLLGTFSAGVKYSVIPKMALNFSLGIRYQEVKLDNPNSHYDPDQQDYLIRSMNQLNIRAGIIF
jgi:hypothetical protein